MHKVTHLFASCCILICLLTARAHAAHPLSTDDTGTSGAQKFQLETSFESAWDRERNSTTVTRSNSQTLNAAITAGILDSVDLTISYPYIFQQITVNGLPALDNSGFSDLCLELKWRFLEVGPFSLAAKPGITLPSGNRNRGLGEGRPGYSLTLISSLDLKPLALHANVGYTNQRYLDADRDGSRKDIWSTSLGASLELLKNFQLVAEVGTATNPDKTNSAMPAYITGGAIYSFNDNLDIDLGVRGGLNTSESDIALLAGLTFKFP